MSAGRIASRYAKSLLELAREAGILERILEDIEGFQKSLASRDLYLMLRSPIIHVYKKIQILKLIFEKHFDPLTMNFVATIARKGREAMLPEIVDEFISQYKILKRISTVYLTSAQPLQSGLIKRIEKVLEEGNDTFEHIELHTKIDPAIIGGFVIEIGDRLYDASVKYKLESLKKEFAVRN